MKKTLDIKKLVLLNMPYILMGLFATNFGEAWRMAQGADASEKFLSLVAVLPGALQSFWPSLHPLDLLVGLCHKEGREWEDFGDVTINLPYQFLEPNEAFITGDFTKDMLHFIKEHKLGKVLNETGRSGYATYQKVAFDLARLAEFDPEGVAEHCRFAGIEVPKEKPQKTKKQSRGKER